MVRPTRLEDSTVASWLASHSAWKREGALIRSAFRFNDFSAALAFTVRVGLAAEKHDHHPEIAVGWGHATVSWTTHDSQGLTALDLQLAEVTDVIFEGAGR